MSSRAIRTLEMSVDNKKLVQALKKKRNAEGLSLRKLSLLIGVSFSTLARIERGDGEPDNNSFLRILDWLGLDGEQAGLKFENVALVHFRAAKNVASSTTKCLLEAAACLKKQYPSKIDQDADSHGESNDSQGQALALSKPEMEEMSFSLRSDLKLSNADPLNALGIRIKGVEVLVPAQVNTLSEDCLEHLVGKGADEWSAMSVPLNIKEDRWVILRNDQHTIERQRVTYLEECWHILLGHKLTKVAKIGNAYGRTFEGPEEHDAFYLAAASLLPEDAVRAAVEQGSDAREIGSKFGTSAELVEYRIKRMGLWRIYKALSIELSGD